MLTSGYIGKVILFHFQLPVPFVGIRKKKKRKKNEMRFKNDEPNLALSRGTQVQYCTFVPSLPGLQSRLPRDRINIRQAARHLCTHLTDSLSPLLQCYGSITTHHSAQPGRRETRSPSPTQCFSVCSTYICKVPYIRHMYVSHGTHTPLHTTPKKYEH